MKKNGFISTSLIYTFFIVFLLMMIFLLNSYSRVRFLLEEFKYDIKESFANESIADVNLYFVIYDSTTGGYEITNEMPSFGYSYDSEFSYCKNGSKITYINNHISVKGIFPTQGSNPGLLHYKWILYPRRRPVLSGIQ